MLPRVPQGWLMGIDASRFQGRLDVPALQRAGVSFISAKASDGLHDEDQQWVTTSAACARYGMPLSPYGVIEAYPRAQAELQARHFIDVVKDTPFTLPPVMDFELPARPDQISGTRAGEVLSAARAWVETVEDGLGQPVIVYTGLGFMVPLARLAGPAAAADVAALGRRELWAADYGSGKEPLSPETYHPRIPAPWTRAVWWQSGPAGATLPGRNTAVDIDWFHGSAADLAAMSRGGGVRQVCPFTR